MLKNGCRRTAAKRAMLVVRSAVIAASELVLVLCGCAYLTHACPKGMWYTPLIFGVVVVLTMFHVVTGAIALAELLEEVW